MPRLPPALQLLTTGRLLLAVMFITLTLGISGYSSDVFLHLATGKHILATGALPAGDPFSFTRPGTEWVMHEWLWQIALYLVYTAFGFAGLKLLGAGVLTIALYINVRSCELLGASTVVGWVTAITLFLTWSGFIGVRPHIITYLFFVFTLHALLRYRQLGTISALYVLPLIMPVWVNSHGGFIIGLVLPGYFLVLHAIDTRLSDGCWRAPWPLAGSLLLSLVTSLLNPYGYEQWLFPFQLMNQWALGYITEWQPLALGGWQGLIFLAAVMLLLMTSVTVGKKERIFRLLLILPFSLAAIDAIRHLPLAAFVIAPLLSSQIVQALDTVRRQWARIHPATAGTSVRNTGVERQELGALEFMFNWMILSGLCLALYLAYPAYTKYEANAIQKNFPIGATRWLVEHHTQGRMFTSMEYSTYILLARYPEQKLFYDVRAEMYGDELAHDYLTMVYALKGWQGLFEKYAIDYAVLDKTKPIYAAMAGDGDYVQIYDDDASAIFLMARRN